MSTALQPRITSQPDGPASPLVAAVLLPGERSSVDAAGDGCFSVVHRESVTDAVRMIRERPVDALLVSVHRCPGDAVAEVRRAVTDFPGMAAVALVSRTDPELPDRLLRLGASGVRAVVDVTRPAGWNRLRQLMAEPTARPSARILAPTVMELPDLAPDGRLFLEAMIRLAPDIATVRGLARAVGQQPSTLMSRFNRAGLPSAKRYLTAIRLLYAAQYFEQEGLSVADVAYRLDCSSPQSFGRHVRSLLGVTCSEFRHRFPFPVAMERFLATMVRPHRVGWRRFRAGEVRLEG